MLFSHQVSTCEQKRAFGDTIFKRLWLEDKKSFFRSVFFNRHIMTSALDSYMIHAWSMYPGYPGVRWLLVKTRHFWDFWVVSIQPSLRFQCLCACYKAELLRSNSEKCLMQIRGSWGLAIFSTMTRGENAIFYEISRRGWIFTQTYVFEKFIVIEADCPNFSKKIFSQHWERKIWSWRLYFPWIHSRQSSTSNFSFSLLGTDFLQKFGQ